MTQPALLPHGVPEGAVYLPPAQDFSALMEMHKNRKSKRSYLRVYVVFVVMHIKGVMLTDVTSRSMGINRRTWRMGRCLIWTDTSREVPGVWVWTLEDERRARDGLAGQ